MKQQKLCRCSKEKIIFINVRRKGHNIHHKYSVALDIACIKKDKAPSMLKTHESLIAKYFENTGTTTAELPSILVN